MPYQKRILSKLKVQPPVTNSMDKGRHMKIHDNCKTRIMALRLVWVEKSPRHNPENIFPKRSTSVVACVPHTATTRSQPLARHGRRKGRQTMYHKKALTMNRKSYTETLRQRQEVLIRDTPNT